MKGLTIVYGKDSINVHTYISRIYNTLLNNKKFKNFPSWSMSTKDNFKEVSKIWNRWNKFEVIIVGKDPESGLHPNEQIELAKFISKYIIKGYKFVISSYSLLFIRSLEYYLAKKLSKKELNKLFHVCIVDDKNKANTYDHLKLKDIYTDFAEAIDTIADLKFKGGKQ